MTNIPELRTRGPRNAKGHLSPTEGLQIPFGIVEGAQDGPTLLVTAGIHGSELCSIEAALRLMNFDAHKLSGTLFILPVVNFHGFRARSIFVNPQDGKNLNRQFPGNPGGTASERLAHWLSSNIFPNCDAYLDLHGGDLDEALEPFVIFSEDSEASKQLAVAFGLETIVVASGSRPVSSSYAARLRIPAITAEAGCNGLVCEDNVSIHYDGVMRVMLHLGMLSSPSDISFTPSEPRFVKLSVPIASAEGLWYPRYHVGAHVAINDVLGDVRDVFGKILVTVRAEVSGEVLYQLTSLWTTLGALSCSTNLRGSPAESFIPAPSLHALCFNNAVHSNKGFDFKASPSSTTGLSYISHNFDCADFSNSGCYGPVLCDSTPAPNGGKEWETAFLRAGKLVDELTLQEKVSWVTGQDAPGSCAGQNGNITRLGIPMMCYQDSPAGLSLGHTQWPSGVTTAATWDTDLIYARSYAMDQDFYNRGIHVALGIVTGRYVAIISFDKFR